MNLLQLLIQADQWLFRLINGVCSNPFFDLVLPWCRERYFWAPLYVFIVAFLGINLGKKGWVVALGLVAAVGLTDFTSSSVVKKNIRRVRPCNDPEMVENIKRRVPCGGGYSFTSSHAANHFAVAVFLIGALGLRGRWQQKALLSWAGLIAFSQVYVGVHYPLDILGGALLGGLIGWAIFRLWQRLFSMPPVFNHQYP